MVTTADLDLRARLSSLTAMLRRVTTFRPNTLQRYLLVQNIFLSGLCIGVGTCIYLLQDLVETLDNFVQADVGIWLMLWYFATKLPLILSQILPAVYLLSVIVQIGLLVRHRELLALQAGGVSFSALVCFFSVYGLVWCLLQLFLSQGLAVAGQREMDRIWQEDVKKREVGQLALNNVWFLNGPNVVSVQQAFPEDDRGNNLTVYVYGDENTLQRIVQADSFVVTEQGWELKTVRVYDTVSFNITRQDSLFLEISQELDAFGVLQQRFDPGALSLWQLGRIVNYLEGTGSNVERLRTAWHMKWAYAFSLLVMTFIALALATMIESVYVNIAVGLAVVFVYYVLFVLGASLGEQGFVSPFVGAWLGNIIFGILAGSRLVWSFLPRKAM
jgi:lipopolysaccharide export system permease protein